MADCDCGELEGCGRCTCIGVLDAVFSDRDPKIVIISTPRTKDSYIEELWRRSKEPTQPTDATNATKKRPPTV